MAKTLWLLLAFLSLGLGMAGVALPLLPTTPFLILAAFAFGKGSERWHRWLIEHPRFGPPLLQWQEQRAISRSVKVSASLMMTAALAVTIGAGVSRWAIYLQAAVLTAVATFLWSVKDPTDQLSGPADQLGGPADQLGGPGDS